ncbi:MAG: tRNA lysidine(34) synthetase TilS [Candidatus Omnitrophota bacterium]
MKSHIIEQFLKTSCRAGLINKNDRILIGVSGGPDSVCLLYLLNSIKKKFNLYLHIAHLDHGLRKDSHSDRLFVEQLVKKLNLPCATEKIQVKKIARKSLEETAREIRYDFFFKIAKKKLITKIAVGHNLDDQAETVLMRIIRGSGIEGMSAISPKKQINGFTIIRPLIETMRYDIEKYLKQKRIAPRQDYTNKDAKFLRNRIRKNLLPILEQYNPNIKKNLSNLAQILSQDFDYLNNQALEFFNKKISKKRGLVKINLDALKKLHPSLQNLVIRNSIEYLAGNKRQFSFVHLKEIQELISFRPNKSIVDLPHKIQAIKTKKSLVLQVKA